MAWTPPKKKPGGMPGRTLKRAAKSTQVRGANPSDKAGFRFEPVKKSVLQQRRVKVQHARTFMQPHTAPGDSQPLAEGRMIFIMFMLTLMFGGMMTKLVMVAMLPPLEPRASIRDLPVEPGRRGNIYDRNGVLMAATLQVKSLYADPQRILDVAEAVEKIRTVLPELSETSLTKILRDDKRRFVWLKRRLTPLQAQELNSLGIPGLSFRSEYVRLYPHRNLASHVLGAVNVDNAGLAGVELAQDNAVVTVHTRVGQNGIQTCLQSRRRRGCNGRSVIQRAYRRRVIQVGANFHFRRFLRTHTHTLEVNVHQVLNARNIPFTIRTPPLQEIPTWGYQKAGLVFAKGTRTGVVIRRRTANSLTIRNPEEPVPGNRQVRHAGRTIERTLGILCTQYRTRCTTGVIRRPAHPAGGNQLRKQTAARLIPNCVGVGEVVGNHADGLALSIQPGHTGSHCTKQTHLLFSLIKSLLVKLNMRKPCQVSSRWRPLSAHRSPVPCGHHAALPARPCHCR